MTLNRDWQADGWLGPQNLTFRSVAPVLEIIGRGGAIKHAGRPACVEILGGLGSTVLANATHLRWIASQCTILADDLDRLGRDDSAHTETALDALQPSLFGTAQ